MLFSLDVIRARKGDCLILHYGPEDDPRVIMIDGGPKSVYKPHLRPRIEKIREVRNVPEKEPLGVDLLMVSHVDDDHIQGILDLTKELTTAQQESRSQLLQVFSFWHNSFDNLIGGTPAQLTANINIQFPTASTEGGLSEDVTLDVENEDEETIVSSIKVLASIEQGSRLRGDAKRLEIPFHPEIVGDLILAEENGQAVPIGPGLKFTVVGPMKPELVKLHKKHQEWLIELKEKGKSPPDALASYVDKSVPNLSSIVVLAEAGDKSVLLTGDARGDKILKGLELVGRLEKGGQMPVDILKVPHHGSSNNLDDDFFERIIAKHYVFSGDGEHGNPERETLEMLLKARGDANYKIHLTYPIDEIDVERKKDWEKEQRKEETKKAKNPAKEVREDWSDPEHSLQALFDAHPDFAKKVVVVEEGDPHVIDLLDEVGF